MSIIEKSMRQMLRTPVRTALFLLLLVLSAALLALGAGLYLLTIENTRRLENVFTTIGTVEQKEESMRQWDVWDAEKGDYVSRGMVPVFGPVISDEVLYFEDANYIIPPVHRPYYGAYDFTWKVHNQDWAVSFVAQWRESFTILEVTPFEDCIPDHPVRVKVVKEIYGVRGEGKIRQPEDYENFWFCDHYNPNPAPMFAGKTYVMALSWKREHSEFPQFTHEYFPSSFENDIREHRPAPRYGELAVASTQYLTNGQLIPDELPLETPWEEVTEGFYDTPRGKRWLNYAKAMYIGEYTIPVVPTDSTKLLMSFYNGYSSIIDGRDISAEEYKDGARVCLVTQTFSKGNGLLPGDKLTLPLYYVDYRDSAGRDFSPNDGLLGIDDHLLNTKGEIYEVFEENEYTIVGIYNESNKTTRSTGYDMPANAVVIPASSVENSGDNNILDFGPMKGYNTTFQIPNGSIPSFMEAWEKQGINGLELTFYDKGYTQVKDGLEQIQVIALVLLVTGVLIAFFIILFFCQLFIGKQKKRTAIERSLGVTKRSCALSLLSGIIVIVFLGSVIGSAAGYVLTGAAMRFLTGKGETFNTEYSSWVNAADASLEIEFDTTPARPSVYAATGAFVVILSIGIALVGIRGNLKSEPLKLLSMRET